jgi:hypothetical protein
MQDNDIYDESHLDQEPSINDILSNLNPGYYFTGFSHLDDTIECGVYRIIISIENKIVSFEFLQGFIPI